MKVEPQLLSLSRAWRGLLAAFIVLAVPAAFFAYMNRPMLAVIPLTVIPLLVLVTTPRWAAYTFILTWGIFLPFKTGLLTVHLMDIGFVLLLTAVVLEYLLKRDTAVRKTGFDMVFLGLIVTATLSGIFAYRSTLSIVPILRIIVIYTAFRLLFKLASEIGIRRLLEYFLALTFVLSLATTAQLILTGGSVRVFGPAHLGMQYFVMTGIPISLCFFIWSHSTSDRARYAVYALFMFVAMLATQSRAPLLSTAIAVPVLLVAAGRKLESGSDGDQRKNLRLVWILVITGAVGVLAFGGSLFAGAIERVQDFITTLGQPRGTVALRLILWRAALDTFLAHPPWHRYREFSSN